MLRSFHHHQFLAERLVEAKRGRRVSVCLPAKDEAATIGPIVDVMRSRLMVDHQLVDELVVIDDGSVDATAAVAAAAGADVITAADVLAEYGTDGGKGQAMWKGLHVTTGDIVAFCDADVTNFGPEFVTGTVGPLLLRDDVGFVKAFYERPLDGRAGEGGRVTELVARPLISLLFPHLASLVQPLAGECAGRREVLEQVPFVDRVRRRPRTAHRRLRPLRRRQHRPVRPGPPGAPQPSALRAQPPGHGDHAARPGPGRYPS